MDIQCTKLFDSVTYITQRVVLLAHILQRMYIMVYDHITNKKSEGSFYSGISFQLQLRRHISKKSFAPAHIIYST